VPFHRAAGPPQENPPPPPLSSLLLGPFHHPGDPHTDQEEDLHRRTALLSEDEDEDDYGTIGDRKEEEAGGGDEDEDDVDSDEDYEEMVVQPRPLNEVTCFTDQTSPWTSIVSDPELGSVESLEVPEGGCLDPAHGEEVGGQLGPGAEGLHHQATREDYSGTRLEVSGHSESDHSTDHRGSQSDVSEEVEEEEEGVEEEEEGGEQERTPRASAKEEDVINQRGGRGSVDAPARSEAHTPTRSAPSDPLTSPHTDDQPQPQTYPCSVFAPAGQIFNPAASVQMN